MSVKGRRLLFLLLSLVLVSVLVVLFAQRSQPSFEIVAGGTGVGFAGDGGPAARALLSEPRGIALDSSGNLFIADSGNAAIRKVDTHGILTTLISNRQQAVDQPHFGSMDGLATDSRDNLYIADAAAHSIYKLENGNKLTRVAGIGTKGYAGDGGPAMAAALNEPRSIAVDAQGNLFIADKGNNRVRKVDAKGIISTVAGSGKNGEELKENGAFEPASALIGDGGPALKAIIEPRNVAVDVQGNLFIGTAVRIRKVDPQGIITTVVGGGKQEIKAGMAATNAAMQVLRGLCLDSAGSLYFTTIPAGFVYRVDSGGILTVAARNPGRLSGKFPPMVFPSDVRLDSQGHIYVSDLHTGHVVRF